MWRRLEVMGARGFSLVELMIVISLVGLLAAISAPSISRSMERSRLNELNRDLANGFLEARSFAMSSGEVVYAQVNLDNDRVQFFLPDNFQDSDSPAMGCAIADMPNPVPALNADDTLFYVSADEYGVDQKLQGNLPNNPNPMILCFSPSGKVLSENGAVLQSGCADNNYMLWVGRKAPASECPDFDDSAARDKRAIDNVFFIHVSYGGQVSVRQ